MTKSGSLLPGIILLRGGVGWSSGKAFLARSKLTLRSILPLPSLRRSKKPCSAPWCLCLIQLRPTILGMRIYLCLHQTPQSLSAAAAPSSRTSSTSVRRSMPISRLSLLMPSLSHSSPSCCPLVQRMRRAGRTRPAVEAARHSQCYLMGHPAQSSFSAHLPPSSRP